MPDATEPVDMPDTPQPVSPAEPLQGERPHMHRAFCLWMMQDEDARSLRAVARAVGRGETTVRGWKGTRNWNARAIQLGPSGITLGIRQYRARYFKRYASRELACVEKYMSTPFLEDELPMADGSIATGEAQRTDARHDLDLDDRRRQTNRHVKLLDGVIGTFVKQLQSGKVKVGVREVAHVIRLRHELADIIHGTGDTAQPAVAESARVRIARTNGSDVVEAMHQDAQELVAIFGALIGRRDNQEPAGEVVDLEAAKEAKSG